MTLPTTRTFITNLLSSLNLPTIPSDNTTTQTTTSAPTPSTSRNPLRNLPPNQKALLTTLHVLFPTELLPALDLLDRDLITRFTVSDTPTTRSADSSPGRAGTTFQDSRSNPPGKDSNSDVITEGRARAASIYHVRSAQQQQQHHSSSSSGKQRHGYRDVVAMSTHYEVRPCSWSCSCPAFAFSAFPAAAPEPLSANTAALSAHPTEEAHVWGDNSGSWDQCRIVGGLSRGEDVPMCKHLLACVLVEQTGLFGQFVREEEVLVEEVAGWGAGWGG